MEGLSETRETNEPPKPAEFRPRTKLIQGTTAGDTKLEGLKEDGSTAEKKPTTTATPPQPRPNTMERAVQGIAQTTEQ